MRVTIQVRPPRFPAARRLAAPLLGPWVASAAALGVLLVVFHPGNGVGSGGAPSGAAWCRVQVTGASMNFDVAGRPWPARLAGARVLRVGLNTLAPYPFYDAPDSREDFGTSDYSFHARVETFAGPPPAGPRREVHAIISLLWLAGVPLVWSAAGCVWRVRGGREPAGPAG